MFFAATLFLTFAVATAIPASAQTTTIELDPTDSTNAVGSDHTVTATVEIDGVPEQGAAVHFDVSAEGTAVPGEGDEVTDADGEATFTFSNDAAVTNTITACVDENTNNQCDMGEPSDTASKTWETPVATSIEVTPATDTNPVGSTHTATATVTDQFDEPYQGAAVHFDVTGDGTPVPDEGDDVTGANGKATFSFANATAGTNEIIACIDANMNETCGPAEPSDTAEKIWEVRVPSGIELTPEAATNPVGTDHTVSATVTDQFDDPIAGAAVVMTVSGTGSPTPTSVTANSNANGRVHLTFTNPDAAVNTITGCIDENASNTCNMGEPTDTATKTWAVPVANAIDLAPAESTNRIGSTHTVTASVTDQFDQPFGTADVHFDVTGDGTPNPAEGDDVTDASGEATFSFSNADEGTNTITACIDENENEACGPGEPSASVTKTWVLACPGYEDDTRNQVVGTPGDDVLIGTEGADVICGLGGDDILRGLEGDDVLLGGPGADILRGGPGADLLAGGGGPDRLVGGAGDDVLQGGNGRDILRGGGGADTLRGQAGNDRLFGGPGNDQLFGGPGNDLLDGGGGTDLCRGGGGRNVIRRCEHPATKQ